MADTRVVHRVRCRKKGDSRVWADVKVVDAFTLNTPGGKSILMWTRAKDAVPFIVDKTNGGNAKGDSQSCTRVSHMELVSDPADSKQKMYVEKLDALAFKAPPFNTGNEAGVLDLSDANHGMPEAAVFGRGPYAITCPENEAVKHVVDNTGLGAGTDNQRASRSGHVSIVTEKGNTDDKTDGIASQNDSIPPKKLAWCAVVVPDAINVKVPDGDVTIIINKGIWTEVDSTQMTTDPNTQEPCPPDNTDPNVYVDWPTKDTDGDSIGGSVKIPEKGPIDTGMLWWIERVSPTFRPWFWFADINTPKAFSYFGAPGSLGSWPWRGFVLWNYRPVIWILARNNPLVSLGQFGSSNLDLCARKGDWQLTYPPAPSGALQGPIPEVQVHFPFTGLSFVPPGALGGDEEPDDDPTFGPFGGLPMTQPPLKPPLNSGIPNVWQLTGRDQPPLSDPKSEYDAFTNPYTPPSSKEAEDLAFDFKAKWNAVANGHNAFMATCQGEPAPGAGRTQFYDQPPGWSWSVPYYDDLVPANRFAFQNGIPPGIGTLLALPLVVYTVATSWTMDVGQLDAKVWDDTHLEFYNNPINSVLPLVAPPFPWDNDPWTGTGTGH